MKGKIKRISRIICSKYRLEDFTFTLMIQTMYLSWHLVRQLSLFTFVKKRFHRFASLNIWLPSLAVVAELLRMILVSMLLSLLWVVGKIKVIGGLQGLLFVSWYVLGITTP